MNIHTSVTGTGEPVREFVYVQRKGEARPLVRVSALCSFSALTLTVWQQRDLWLKNPNPQRLTCGTDGRGWPEAEMADPDSHRKMAVRRN